MNIIDLKLKDLKPYENNPRRNDNAVEYVENSIKQFGFKVPLVIDKDNVIVCGHTRYKAAKKLGIDTVPCVVADDLTDEQIKAFRLADNKVGSIAEWDFDLLGEELDGIFDIDMSEFGFDLDFETSGESSGEPAEPKAETSFNYTEQYGVIVMCSDEAEQEQIYNRLTDEGYTCKVVAV